MQGAHLVEPAERLHQRTVHVQAAHAQEHAVAIGLQHLQAADVHAGGERVEAEMFEGDPTSRVFRAVGPYGPAYQRRVEGPEERQHHEDGQQAPTEHVPDAQQELHGSEVGGRIYRARAVAPSCIFGMWSASCRSFRELFWNFDALRILRTTPNPNCHEDPDALPFLFLVGFDVSAPVQAHALADDGAFNAIKAFTKLQSKSGKLLDKVKPWNDLMKQNESSIPADIKPRYDDFNKLVDGFNGSMAKFSADPASLTEEAFKGLNGDLGKDRLGVRPVEGPYEGVALHGRQVSGMPTPCGRTPSDHGWGSGPYWGQSPEAIACAGVRAGAGGRPPRRHGPRPGHVLFASRAWSICPSRVRK